MDNNFKVRIWQDFSTEEIRMVFLSYHQPGTEVINLYTGKVETVEEGDTIPSDYIIKLPRYFADDLLKALAEALDEKNIKTDNDAKIQGVLEATKYHLEDMRKIALTAFNFNLIGGKGGE
jgi:hypothetical protein